MCAAVWTLYIDAITLSSSTGVGDRHANFGANVEDFRAVAIAVKRSGVSG